MHSTKPSSMARTVVTAALVVLPFAAMAEPAAKTSSYAPVAISEDFGTIMARMKAAKTAVEKRQADLLSDRYDLSTDPRRVSPCRAARPCGRVSASGSRKARPDELLAIIEDVPAGVCERRGVSMKVRQVRREFSVPRS